MADPDTGLQFDRAEFEGNAAAAAAASCAACKRTLADTYYQVGGVVVCENCKGTLESEANQPSVFSARVGRLLRATLFGSLAAVAGCALYYGVLAITGWEVGLISILVGVMVGGAVKAGARRRGGWLYQGLAMFLTYTSIIFSYLPIIFKEAAGSLEKVQQEGPLAIVVMSIVAVPLLYALPFILVAQDGSAFLSLLIIGFGVYQAWVINKKETLQISGPYSLAAPTQAASAPEAPPEPIRP